MLSKIVIINNRKFTQKVSGNEFTLEEQPSGKWSMTVMNASVKAYRNGFAMPKEFDSLIEVEARYKSWRGFSKIKSSLSDINIENTTCTMM